ncbi:MAG TPA: hypothetical protein VGM01_10945, partial [Ktedonobacteraceae bacterium]
MAQTLATRADPVVARAPGAAHQVGAADPAQGLQRASRRHRLYRASLVCATDPGRQTVPQTQESS